MCGQDVFETVTENIRALKEAGVDIRLNLSITPHNRQDIRKIYEISRELNVHIKASSYMYPPVRSGNRADARLSAEEAAKLSVEWDRLRFSPEEFAGRAESIRVMSLPEKRECSVDLDEGVSCRAGYSTFWITWDGRMLPCGMMPGPEAHPLKDGFDAAWEYIRTETRKLRLPKECAACTKREICAACAAVCVTETGRFDGVPEYMCRMTEEILEQTKRVAVERSKE
jgi:radical SAM protein with 4Fe4S-binding SPASM domain